jgi:hypothetical protein
MTNAELITALGLQPAGQTVRFQGSAGSRYHKIAAVSSVNTSTGAHTVLLDYVVGVGVSDPSTST